MLLNSNNFQQRQINTRRKQENLQHHPSTISLCKALQETCLLQIEPLSTTNFLPRPCWDLRTASEIQLFQQRRVAQCLKQICSAICTFRVSVEAPGVFCQNQSVEKTWGRGQSEGTGIEDKKTFLNFSLQGTVRNLPSSSWATWHYELFARPLLGSENRQRNPTLPAVSTGSTLQANLRRHLLLGCFRWSTCSVLSESICWKHVETVISGGISFILNPYRSLQVNSNSYNNITNLYKSELGQHPTETNKYTT